MASHEDTNGENVHTASVEEAATYGCIGTLWGALVFINTTGDYYDIEAYGGNCMELLLDHPDLWDRCQERGSMKKD